MWNLLKMKNKDYSKDDMIEFNVYGTTVVGKFVKLKNDKITIETFNDSVIADKVGKLQSIHISHPNKLYTA